MAGAGGGLFVAAGLLCLIPVAWTTHDVVQTFYLPTLPSSYKHELGECLFVGLASALMSLLGGAVLCASCCGTPDGRRGGGRRPRGVYPYPERNASFPRHPPHPMTFRSQPSQTGVRPETQNPSHMSSSSQSSGPKKSPRHTTAAAGYDVTGYV